MTLVKQTNRRISFFDDQRLTQSEAIELTAQALIYYIGQYPDVVVSYSGGKDSTSLLTLLLVLIEAGRVPRPRSLRVLLANTRVELPLLHLAALQIMQIVREKGYLAQVVEPPLDDRFFVRMFGFGYPPPHNGFRWCTDLLKLKPMLTALLAARQAAGQKFLALTGMRIGESAMRDQRIVLACGSKDGECGQGAILAQAQEKARKGGDKFGLYESSPISYLFTHTPASEPADVLSPLLHWRVCHVADWLMLEAPSYGFPTHRVLEAYGAGVGDSEPLEARTGCIACPVAGNGDPVLVKTTRLPGWEYLRPLLRLRDLYNELSRPKYRLKKSGERNKDGKLSSRPNRGGPLLFESRLYGMEQVLRIQAEVNEGARAAGRPELVLISDEEKTRILELIEAETWPQKWSGDDLRGDALVDLVVGEGLTQPVLAGLKI
jgi:DNA sulfur modification protein DndC